MERDPTTKNAFARLPVNSIDALRNLTLPERVEALKRAIGEAQMRCAALKMAGLIYAREHWRTHGEKSRYLILVYPMKNGVRPPSTYIGCDPQKVQAARDGIRRAAAHDEACRLIAALERELQAAEAMLRSGGGGNNGGNAEAGPATRRGVAEPYKREAAPCP